MTVLTFTHKETKCNRGSIVSLVSDLSLPQAAMKFETLTQLTVWPLQRSSVSRVFDVTVTDAPSQVWKLFLHIRNCKFLTYADVIPIEDAKQQMQTKNSRIHTPLVAIRREKTKHYDVSPDDKRRLEL